MHEVSIYLKEISELRMGRCKVSAGKSCIVIKVIILSIIFSNTPSVTIKTFVKSFNSNIY